MKLGLVLEGGASRAYFSVGAMDALMDLGIKANYIIGASAGIANGISYASGQYRRNLEIGLKYLSDKRYMGAKHYFNLKNKSYYNIDFVFNEIPNKHLPFDYDALDSFDGEVYAAVTNLETGEAEYIKVDSSDKKWLAITASCALPLMFPPIKIGNSLYFDGGVADPIPYKKALQDGCEKLIVILTRPRDYFKKDDKSVDVCRFIYRKYTKFGDVLLQRGELYNKCRKELFELEKEGKVIIIEPDSTDNWKRTERRPEMIQAMYDEGYKKATNTIKTGM